MFSKLVNFLLSREISYFKDKKGHFELNFPLGWRIYKSPKNEHLFIESSTNNGLVIKSQLNQENKINEILKGFEKHSLLDYEKCDYNGMNLIKWAFEFKKENVLELKRLFYNDKVIVEVSYCIKRDLNHNELIKVYESESEIFSTLALSE